MIQMIPFKAKHYIDMDFEEFPFSGWFGRLREMDLQRVAENPYFVTVTTPQGFPIMVFGATPLAMNVYEVFILPGRGWTEYTVSICRLLKEKLEHLSIFSHRIQAICSADDEKYARFLEMLKFKREGVLRKFDAVGRDYFIYARVEGD